MKRTKNPPAPSGLVTPFQVIPLRVYAAWKASSWTELAGDRYLTFYCDKDGVHARAVNRSQSQLDEPLGPLPNGWACCPVTHRESGVDECFVGPAATIAELVRLQEASDEAQAAIERLIHHAGA